MPAESRTLIAGGNLDARGSSPRTWATNWPLHLVVAGTALLGLVVSPGPLTALLVLLWLAVYAAAHWAVVLRGLPGAGAVSVTALGAIALALEVVSHQGLHLFAAFMLMWVLLSSYRAGLAATLVLATGLMLVLLPAALDGGAADIAVVLASGIGSALFSILMASWIWQTERLSHERRELAEELATTVGRLEDTRTELLVLEHRRGAEEEATRFAAEIHDTLAQSFTSITMLSQAARQADAAGQGDAAPASLLEQIEEVSREGLAQSRALISRTQPPLDLAGTLDRLSSDLEGRTGVRTRLDATGWSSVATRTEVVLLRTVQEALRNIEHHADASSVRIRLSRENAEALLEVADDGTGFDTDLPTAGYGLVGMRSRLEAEGGALHLSSSRGTGTTLRATLPMVVDAPIDRTVHPDLTETAKDPLTPEVPRAE
ncbi:MAG: sensor histidine kinase [Brachybacterium sp.]|nr:sensor histidine kinase [Brachybacterium sp.]